MNDTLIFVLTGIVVIYSIIVIGWVSYKTYNHNKNNKKKPDAIKNIKKTTYIASPNESQVNYKKVIIVRNGTELKYVKQFYHDCIIVKLNTMQKNLAKELGIDAGTLSKYINNSMDLSNERKIVISNKLIEILKNKNQDSLIVM